MIYVIISPIYVKKGDYTRFENALKIGYSSDNRKTHENRFNTYVTQNPTCEILFKVMEGTKRDEKNLHKYFSRYQKKFEGTDTREWFEYREEILEFFETHTTIESIRNEIKPSLSKRVKKRYKEKLSKSLPIAWPYIAAIRKITNRLDYTMLEDYSCDDTEEFCEDWIKIYYPKEADEIISYYKSVQSKITPEMKESIYKFRKTGEKYFSDRLREFCELDSNFTSEEKEIIAQQVSEKFDRMYNYLGPERCKALCYNTTLMNKELGDMLIPSENIMSEMHDYFEVGKRYTNKFIKEKVREIYEHLKLFKTPKAVDILDFFKVKKVQIINEKKKKINGYEILGVKS